MVVDSAALLTHCRVTEARNSDITAHREKLKNWRLCGPGVDIARKKFNTVSVYSLCSTVNLSIVILHEARLD